MRVGCTQDGGLLCWLIEESRSYPSAAVSVARSVSRHKTGSETLVVIENLASIDRFPSAVCRYVFAGVSRLKDSMVLDAVVRFCSELVKWRSTPPLCELWAPTVTPTLGRSAGNEWLGRGEDRPFRQVFLLRFGDTMSVRGYGHHGGLGRFFGLSRGNIRTAVTVA